MTSYYEVKNDSALSNLLGILLHFFHSSLLKKAYFSFPIPVSVTSPFYPVHVMETGILPERTFSRELFLIEGLLSDEASAYILLLRMMPAPRLSFMRRSFC